MSQRTSHIVKQKIPAEKLNDIFIVVNGQKKVGQENKIIINGIEIARGIKRVELILDATEYPELTIEYGTHLIPQEICDALGLESENSN